MISQDYSTKRWFDDYKPKKSIKNKVLLAIAGLGALVINYIINPEFYKNMSIPLKSTFEYGRKIPYTIKVIGDMTTLDDYGKKHGLKGIKLEIWKGNVLGHNHYLIKLDPEKAGIDRYGKFYPGGIVNMIEP
jgi:hypothetical protein